MSSKSTLLSLLLMINLSACEEAQVQNGVSAEEVPKRELIQSNNSEDLSCLEQCGQEARGTIYADCLSDGGEQKQCGVEGRQWYRSCLETRCDDDAIQLDDCKTDCRVNKKDDYRQCVSETNAPEECRTTIGNKVRECIDNCEQ